MREILRRCPWADPKNALYLRYHDEEWGVPEHDDRALFELLILEGFQAGLSWACILNKREAFRTAFDGFDYEAVSRYDEEKLNALMLAPGIVHNRLKLRAAVTNAQAFLRIREEFGSFDRYLWQFTEGAVVFEPCDQRVSSPLSDAVSADLKQRGMKFVGTVIVYSYLQAAGVINGHIPGCDCYLFRP